MKNAPTLHKSVWLVDDSEMDLLISETMIKMCKIASRVKKEKNSSIAIEKLKFAADVDTPDLILLDLNMPKMNGFEFLDAFNTLPENVKRKCRIIMLSSSEEENDKQKARTYSYVIDYMVKPLDPAIIDGISW